MATITLNGTSINFSAGIEAFESLSQSFSNSKKSAEGLHKAIGQLIEKIDNAGSAMNTETSKAEAKKSQEREEVKESSLTLAYEKLDELIADVGEIDSDVSDKVSSRKDDFYKEYEYLKPECEKSRWEKFWEGVGDLWDSFCDTVKNIVKNVVEWCNSNIGKIILGIIAVVGAILIIVAVVASGGLALVPLLTALGMSAGLATTISMVVGAVAVVSTALALIPNTLDLAAAIDMVIDPENNKIAEFNDKLHSSKAYNVFQTTMNITSAVSGGIYSIGSIYNSVKGISNADLKLFNRLRTEGYRPGWDTVTGNEVSYLADFFPGADEGITRGSIGGPKFYSVENANGGTIYVSSEKINYLNFADIVNNADGQVTILSGVHGTPGGAMTLIENEIDATTFFVNDTARWGNLANVNVVNVHELPTPQLAELLNGNGTTICAWCFSERSTAVLDALRSVGLIK